MYELSEPDTTRAEEILAYSLAPPHFFSPGERPASQSPEHILWLGDQVKITFFVESGFRLTRRLVVELSHPNLLPHPLAVNSLLPLFGFQGELHNCDWELDQEGRCAIVSQPLSIQVGSTYQ